MEKGPRMFPHLTLDNFDSDEVPDDCPFVLTSPRSLEACRMVGVKVSAWKQAPLMQNWYLKLVRSQEGGLSFKRSFFAVSLSLGFAQFFVFLPIIALL